MSTTWSSFFILVLISFIYSSSTVQATVPKSKTFKYVNGGGYLEYPEIEYGDGVRALKIYTHPFHLMFYGISGTDGLFTLGLAMVTFQDPYQSGDRQFRWVWAANRGKPVHENATIAFGTNGNLVLAEADGRVVWETGTANKGVVDLKLLPNGNLVLLDKRGGFLWQSFDHPTDTLLVGQSLVSGGKLVSRNPDDDSEGHYSLVAKNRTLNFYYNNKNAASKPLQFDAIYVMDTVPEDPGNVRVLKNITFDQFHLPDTKEGRPFSYLLRFMFYNDINRFGSFNLVQNKYNSTLSFIRLESDATVKVYTLYDIGTFMVPGQSLSPWEVTYTYTTTMCQLPEKCGSFGLCENDQCIGCPSPNGLITPWNNKTCLPPKLPSCNNNKGPSSPISYYKMVGVRHFSKRFEEGEGPMKVSQCTKKCSEDCNCVAAFYHEYTSKCVLTTQFSTLINYGYLSEVAFIKYQK